MSWMQMPQNRWSHEDTIEGTVFCYLSTVGVATTTTWANLSDYANETEIWLYRNCAKEFRFIWNSGGIVVLIEDPEEAAMFKLSHF